MKRRIVPPQFPGTAVFLRNRICYAGSSDVLEAGDVDSINLQVFDTADTRNAIADLSITPADVFDALSTTDWHEDSIGFNFEYETLAAHLPTGDRRYYFDFRAVLSNGKPLVWGFEVPTIGVLRR